MSVIKAIKAEEKNVVRVSKDSILFDDSLTAVLFIYSMRAVLKQYFSSLMPFTVCYRQIQIGKL